MLVEKISIGFSYDQAPSSQGISELVEAEYEDEKTLNWLRNTLSGYGKVTDIIWGSDVLSQICSIKPDVIFNITEASGSRNRESLLPALAETAGIAYTGSDAVAMGISLDKFITKVVASHLGIPTPRCVLIDDPFQADADIVLKADLKYPVIVKPNTGGSSMGIYQTSKVSAKEKVMNFAKQIYNKYREKILVEEFIPGREYTAALLEKDVLMTLPLAEIQLYGNTSQGFYSLEIKSRHEKTIICPCSIDNELETSMNDYALRIYKALGCRDMARIDFRVTPEGDIFFIEINPLPGLSPYYSIYPVQAKAAAIEPGEIIGILINNAIKRRRTFYE